MPWKVRTTALRSSSEALIDLKRWKKSRKKGRFIVLSCLARDNVTMTTLSLMATSKVG